MVRSEYIKDILGYLIKEEGIREYSRRDIDKAIILSRGMDKRTIRNWFNTLWILGYFTQPRKGYYLLDIDKAVKLDVQVPIEGAHTQSSESHANSAEASKGLEVTK